MNPWDEVLGRITSRDEAGLAEYLTGLDDADRRTVAAQVPGHLTARLDGASRWQIRERLGGLATGYRLAGAACMSGAAQVAAWLSRRELREVRDPAADAALVMSVLRHRPEAWRRDLAARLVRRVRPPAGPEWMRLRDAPGWELAAALVIETGVEPPESDGFVACWAWRMAARHRLDGGRPVLGDDPLLDRLLPRLFSAQGVADALIADEEESRRQQREATRLSGRPDGSAPDRLSGRPDGSAPDHLGGLARDHSGGLASGTGLSIIGELVALAGAGRVPREALVGGCASRFMAGGEAAGIMPFVTLWRLLETSVAEIPVLDFVRLLPSGASPFVQLALDELRRAEAAGALDDELFAEAIGALVFRPEKKYVTAAVRWLAAAPPSRGGTAVAALAQVLEADLPALRDRAVRLAVKLAPHADEAARDAVREAAARLPEEARERLATAYGPLADVAPPEPLAVAALTAPSLPRLAQPLASAAELAAEFLMLYWPEEPGQYERIMAGLVELSHREREAVVTLLAPHWRGFYGHPDNPMGAAYASNDRTTRDLLHRCVLALVYPDYSRRLTAAIAERQEPYEQREVLPQAIVLRRLREIIHLFEREETIPVLLATPTAATGHVDPETLLDRMERLGDAEPLDADFWQALLRLPREVDEALIVRAEKLPTDAGRRLAVWLRDGALPGPAVRNEPGRPCGAGPGPAPGGLPGWLSELCSVRFDNARCSYPDEIAWWPTIMPSHREVVAKYLVQCLSWLSESSGARAEALVTLAHGDGPVGRATALAIAAFLGHPRPAQRAAAAQALAVLAVRGQFPADDFGWAIAHLIQDGGLSLKRIAASLADLVDDGAHAEVWRAFATALPPLLPKTGDRACAGLGEFLSVAVRAAVLAGARGEVPGLAELAGRKGSSRVLQEARRLHKTI
ncbi:hypothetical protein FXF51_53995 [Nonomuraea sp. PA05]|uniref:DUF7824 domain-containing protein n=1 Tax=Nonomuraea sp. PA05 TaxID=2604466 RepID=UPI0011D9FD16|nr:DUF6493 family protein [Nonomuraea sp. PA05]TYB51103.1 hypothetical protein FXF51_53995 [Nonomuraea sp. PA05]